MYINELPEIIKTFNNEQPQREVNVENDEEDDSEIVIFAIDNTPSASKNILKNSKRKLKILEVKSQNGLMKMK